MTAPRRATGQWLTGSDGVRWFFDSGALSLDFAYTGDFGFGVPSWERWHAPTDLTDWLSDRFTEPEEERDWECDEVLFAEARELRAAIARLARASAGGTDYAPIDVDEVNRWAARPAASRLLPGGTRPSARPTPQAMLAAIAQDAVELFSVSPGRIRACAAEDCRLIFVDTSRSSSRRWCSMQRCGNRAKTRAHYQRTHD